MSRTPATTDDSATREAKAPGARVLAGFFAGPRGPRLCVSSLSLGDGPEDTSDELRAVHERVPVSLRRAHRVVPRALRVRHRRRRVPPQQIAEPPEGVMRVRSRLVRRRRIRFLRYAIRFLREPQIVRVVVVSVVPKRHVQHRARHEAFMFEGAARSPRWTPSRRRRRRRSKSRRAFRTSARPTTPSTTPRTARRPRPGSARTPGFPARS